MIIIKFDNWFITLLSRIDYRRIYRSSIILTALKRLYLDKMTVHPFC